MTEKQMPYQMSGVDKLGRKFEVDDIIVYDSEMYVVTDPTKTALLAQQVIIQHIWSKTEQVYVTGVYRAQHVSKLKDRCAAVILGREMIPEHILSRLGVK